MITRFLSCLFTAVCATAAAQPIVIAHRGASGYLPEHTLPAKALAYAQGADFLEQDIVLSKDDVPVVLHDTQIDTVTDVATRFPDRKRADGRYYALDFTLDELKQLRATERFDAKTGEQIYAGRFPGGQSKFEIITLEEELQFIQGLNHSTGRNVGIYPEIKRPSWHREQGHDISAIVLPILRKYGYASKEHSCWLQCFEWLEVQRLRNELQWQGRLILLMGSSDKTPLAEVAGIADGIGPPIGSIFTGKSPAERTVTDLVSAAHKAGLKVHPYTLRIDDLPKSVGSVDELLDLLVNEAQIDGLFTDFPDVMVRWLAK
ncbi:MAG: glycerophosphodiester phosphodiesterase [Verrucomicrobiales bacterium]|nr:glycerophosphodiester phosphodiesterase [Verrucomicrobiales bacterium]MCP5559622.1 glycerophosphodiester phosphodiesterase [Verrucomicrobiaceae bacterium]